MLKKITAVLCVLSLMISQVMITGVNATADKKSPVFKSSSPRTGESDISVNVRINIKFNENIYKYRSFSKIRLVKKSSNPTSITVITQKNFLIINHKYFLAYNSDYTVTIPSYSIKDKAGNILKKAITIKFKTKPKTVKPTPTKTPALTPTTTVTPTITPTVTPTLTPTPTPTESGLELLDSTKAYYSTELTEDWVSKGLNLGTRNTGEVTVYMDVTPLTENVNATINFADSQTQVLGIENLSATIRFNSNGTIDILNGKDLNQFETLGEKLSYVANKTYHIRIGIHNPINTYCIWITPDGAPTVKVAAMYGYNTTAFDMNDAGKLFLISGEQNKKIRVENIAVASADTPLYTEVPTPANSGTPTPTPTATANASDDASLQSALNNPAVGTIILDSAKTYKGFTVSKPVVIKGNGAAISSGIIVNSNNITIDNVNVRASTYLVTNPIIEVANKHAYFVTPGKTGIIIKNGSITGMIGTKVKGVYCDPSAATDITVDDVDFSTLRNGIVCGGGFVTIINNKFENVEFSVGNTENTTIKALEGNSFTNGTEGIGLGNGVSITKEGQDSTTLISYLKTNNVFTGYAENKDVVDYRK